MHTRVLHMRVLQSQYSVSHSPVVYAAYVICAVCTAAFLCMLTPRAALAAQHVDPNHTCSLEVEVAYDKKPLAGMEFSVRRVAKLDDLGTYVLADAYASADVELNGLTTAEDWEKAASTLAVWAEEHALGADAEARTTADGAACFAKLNPGIYLLTSVPLQDGTCTYTATTYLVALPDAANDGTWNYDVTSICKVSMTEARDDDSDDDSDKGSDTNPDKPTDKASHKNSWPWNLVQTGDNQLTVVGTIFVIGLGTVLVGMAAAFYQKHRK